VQAAGFGIAENLPEAAGVARRRGTRISVVVYAIFPVSQPPVDVQPIGTAILGEFSANWSCRIESQ
jgi:hypothetical protein